MSPVDQQVFEGGFRWQNGTLVPYNPLMAEECQKHFEEGDIYILFNEKITVKKKRTWLQNRSLHLWLTKVAEWLNDSGFTMIFVISMLKKSTLRWTPEAVKEVIWRNIQRNLYQKESTTQLSTTEVIEIHKNIELFFCERLKGVPPPWPDRYTQSLEGDNQQTH